jgi:molybdopterin synthase sulfur carrier subunit
MIRILFFGGLRETLACDETQLAITAPVSIHDIVLQLVQRGDAWQALTKQRLLCALNQQMARSDTLVNPGDELALFPPVTGG